MQKAKKNEKKIVEEEEENLMFEEIDENDDNIDLSKLKKAKKISKKSEIRKISIPYHRLTPLKKNWEKIVTLIVEKMKLLIRMNLKQRVVEIKPSDLCEDKLNVQKAADFLKAFAYGFGINDAIALLRLDDLYLDSFEIKDVKRLQGEHLSRAIGRLTGEKGKTKNSIENATKTRIVVANTKIHILGSFSNIKMAKDSLCALILGSPANKIYSQLRYMSKRKSQI